MLDVFSDKLLEAKHVAVLQGMSEMKAVLALGEMILPTLPDGISRLRYFIRACQAWYKCSRQTLCDNLILTVSCLAHSLGGYSYIDKYGKCTFRCLQCILCLLLEVYI